MRIHQVKAIEGANFFSYRPVIRGIVSIAEWQGKMTDELGDFNQRLLKALPSLADHTCSRGKPGGFVERLEEGTLPGHVLEHVSIELLTLAGEKSRYGKTRVLVEEMEEYEVIYEYECKEAAIEALYAAAGFLNQLRYGEEPNAEPLVAQLKKLRSAYMPGPSTQAILQACLDRGIPYDKLGDGNLYQLGYGRLQKRIQAAMTSGTSCIGTDIAADKQLTRLILSESAIPVPSGKIASSEEEILKLFRQFDSSVVIKPCLGNQGKGVSLNLTKESEIVKACRLAQVYSTKVIIEEYIKGNNYRLLVIGGKLVAAARRRPPMVAGNGKSSIEELIEQENNNPLRGTGHEKYLSKIAVDPILILDLSRQGFSLKSVPHLGEKVVLRQSANLSTGSTAVDVTDLVHRDNAELAVYAASVLGLDIAGIDFILGDIRHSYREQDGRIIEVNAAPGLRMHLLPSAGQSRNIGRDIVNMLLPHGNGRIPIVSVTGTNGKTTVVRLLSKMLRKQQLTVGMTSTEGIYINDRLLSKGDHSGPASARTVLRHPDVQVAVLETARGGILRAGLGYDYADVAIITNISEDHLGQYGIDNIEDLSKVKSLVAERVQKHGFAILNADDPQVVNLDQKTSGHVIYFSTEIQNRRICKHLAFGGVAVVADQKKIWIYQGTCGSTVCNLNKIPITWGGKARHNVQNVLAAVAACYALGYNAPQIRRAVSGFGQNPEDNQGRLEYYEMDGFKVVLDYGHNPAGIKEVVQTLQMIGHKRIVGCIGLPGDRSDATVKQFAREAAAGFDLLYIKEDADLRGRKSGEIAHMIYEEALSEGKKASSMKIILKEEEALREALAKAREGDIVVIFYEKAEPLRKIINDHLNLILPEIRNLAD